MMDLIEVEFVGGPFDGPGHVHPLGNALHVTVNGYPEGYYCASDCGDYSLDPETGWPRSRYYWIVEVPIPALVKLQRRSWWQRLFNL